MSDMSWLGLYKRGIKLQYWNNFLRRWIKIDGYNVAVIHEGENEIRYKHSIQ